MSEAIQAASFPLSQLGKIREVLEIVAAIAKLDDPLTSGDGLRQSIALVLRLADLVGVDDAWIARVESILLDQGVFAIVLAIVRYVSGAAGKEHGEGGIRVTSASGDVIVESQSFFDWLPLVIQLISLIRQIQGNRQTQGLEARD